MYKCENPLVPVIDSTIAAPLVAPLGINGQENWVKDSEDLATPERNSVEIKARATADENFFNAVASLSRVPLSKCTDLLVTLWTSWFSPCNFFGGRAEGAG